MSEYLLKFQVLITNEMLNLATGLEFAMNKYFFSTVGMDCTEKKLTHIA